MPIKDLAAKTGYAVGTVSRALNDHPNVSANARRELLQAAKESGFELNQNAKQLKQLSSTTILVVVKGIGNELFGELVETIQNLIAPTRYQLVVDYMDEDNNEVSRAISLIREKKPLGILFLGGNTLHFLRDFDKIEVPCVLVTNDAAGLPFSNLSSVTTDDRQAGYAAMEQLISQGHRRIAIIGGVKDSDISCLRFEGCLQAMKRQGLDFDPELDYEAVRFSYRDGYDATLRLLSRNRGYTAIFALADVMAIGSVRALWEQGKRVPQDVSVIGVDGLNLGSYLTPRLSTVRQDAPEIARRSVEILLSALETGAPPVHEQISFELLPGESVRKV